MELRLDSDQIHPLGRSRDCLGRQSTHAPESRQLSGVAVCCRSIVLRCRRRRRRRLPVQVRSPHGIRCLGRRRRRPPPWQFWSQGRLAELTRFPLSNREACWRDRPHVPCYGQAMSPRAPGAHRRNKQVEFLRRGERCTTTCRNSPGSPFRYGRWPSTFLEPAPVRRCMHDPSRSSALSAWRVEIYEGMIAIASNCYRRSRLSFYESSLRLSQLLLRDDAAAAAASPVKIARIRDGSLHAAVWTDVSQVPSPGRGESGGDDAEQQQGCSAAEHLPRIGLHLDLRPEQDQGLPRTSLPRDPCAVRTYEAAVGSVPVRPLLFTTSSQAAA